jgi:selenocysteine lyase/cysteine desulfurase
MAGVLALGASLDLLSRFGLSATASPLENRVLELNQGVAERLVEIGASIKSSQEPDHASGILSFDLPGRDLQAVRRRCLDAGVVLSVRHDWLRISPHAYTNADDVDRLIDALGTG